MGDLHFEWNAAKALANARKHRVSIEEASTVFEDDHALFMDDPDHSDLEDRFLLLGLSASLRVLLVCHCYRERDTVIRIISARRATPSERRQYFRRQSP